MDNYIIFDFETSGINSKYAEIIEISAIKISNGVILEEFNTLVKPRCNIDPLSTKTNGITDEMVAESPSILEVLPKFIEFIGNDTLVGYNIVSFDLPILKRISFTELNINIANDYLDILYMARDRLPFLPNRKLTTVASYFCIDTSGAHRAINDCYITKKCYEKLLCIDSCKKESKRKSMRRHSLEFTEETKALQTLQAFLLGVIADNALTESEVLSLKTWLDENHWLSGHYPFDRVFNVVENALSDGKLEKSELDEMLELFKKYTSPSESCSCMSNISSIFGKNICLTGDFEYGTRREIEDLINSAGGSCKSAVSGKTDYVVIGNLGSPDWSCGSYGSKVKKAMELKDKGKCIYLIKEDEFLKLLQKNNVQENCAQNSLFNVNETDFYKKIQDTIDKIIISYELPPKSIHLYSNISSSLGNS